MLKTSWTDLVSSHIYLLEILVVGESLLETVCESVTQLVPCEDDGAKPTLIQNSLPLVVHNVGLVVKDGVLSLMLRVLQIGQDLLDPSV